MNPEPPSRTTDWFSSALDQFEAQLLRYAQRIVGDDHEARDVVQDTFLKLCRQNPEQLNGRLAQWLYSVCRNQALDVRRRKRHASRLLTETARSPEAALQVPGPTEAALHDETVERVQQEITRLSDNQQMCLRLKFQQQLSYREISEITGLSLSNVGFLIHTGLKTVRDRLRRQERIDQPPEERTRP